MNASRSSTRPHVRVHAHAWMLLLLVIFASALASGCASGDEDDQGGSAVVADDGPLQWLPRSTWLVASANVSADTLDDAVNTLDRLPIWALAEGFLPAADGEGLRRAGLDQIAKQVTREERATAKPLTGAALEAAFGDMAGIAIVDNDLSDLEGDDAPIVLWVDVDDAKRAIAAGRQLAGGTITEREHEGITIYSSDSAQKSAFLVTDGLMLVATNVDRLEALIDVRESGESIASDETGSAIIQASMGDELAGFAVATKPLLAASSQLESGKNDVTLSQKQLDSLEQVLTSDAIDHLIPNWIGGSFTIDDTGLRMRGTWSNPRDLPEPKDGARELAERMPATAPIVSAGSSDGSELVRVQDAWAEINDSTQLELDQITEDCPKSDAWACELALEAVRTVLEDRSLASALDDAGDSSSAFTQDISQLLALAAGQVAAETAGAAAPTPPKITKRIYEAAISENDVLEGYTPPAALRDAVKQAGLLISQGSGSSTTIRVRAGSPLARELAAMTPAEKAALTSFGVNVAALQSAKGLTMKPEQVDGYLVGGFPFDAPSDVAAALRGKVDTLGDADRYRDVVDAVKPPEQVGQYGWVDIEGYVSSALAAMGSAEPNVQRAIPTVRNNLADVPGALSWTTRERSAGRDIGVYETVIPILK